MRGADNQQERLALLGYLAGIIDGEGWIGLAKSRSTDTRSGYTLAPQISIHMVGKDSIDYVDNVFRQVGLPSYRLHLRASSRWSVRGFKRVVPVLEALSPYLHIKHRQAELVLEYHVLRKQRSYHRSEPSEREWEILGEIRALNTKGKNPQRLYA